MKKITNAILYNQRNYVIGLMALYVIPTIIILICHKPYLNGAVFSDYENLFFYYLLAMCLTNTSVLFAYYTQNGFSRRQIFITQISNIIISALLTTITYYLYVQIINNIFPSSIMTLNTIFNRQGSHIANGLYLFSILVTFDSIIHLLASTSYLLKNIGKKIFWFIVIVHGYMSWVIRNQIIDAYITFDSLHPIIKILYYPIYRFEDLIFNSRANALVILAIIGSMFALYYLIIKNTELKYKKA